MPATSDEKMVRSYCGLCGPITGCGINCYVKNGKLVRIEGMKECPVNLGKLCPRAYASIEWLYSPNRLKYPLKRVGPKGESKFQQITWDEAIGLIADKLKEQKAKYGPESLAVLSPRQCTYKDYFKRFMIAHGTPNYAHSAICAVQRAFSYAYTIGTPWIGLDHADIANADLVLNFAANPIYSGAPMIKARELMKAKERGAKIITIKPELQPDAAIGDIWVPIRPSTHTALALAMLNIVVNEKLYDAEFVSNWCYGFDKFVPHIQKYTPEWAAPITGVPVEQIKQITRMYATTKAACILPGNSLDQITDSNQATRAITILLAITGHLDRKGGNIVSQGTTMPKARTLLNLHRLLNESWVEKLVAPEMAKGFEPFIEGPSSAYYKCFESILTGKPYPIRAIIAPGTQPPVSTRNPGLIIEALKKLDFFVTVDVMENSAMPWADIVMPVTTGYETDYPFQNTAAWIMARTKVVEPLGPYKSDYEFWLDLGTAMGYGENFWNGDIEACMDYQLENFGMKYKELREKYPVGIKYPPIPPVYEKYQGMFSSKKPWYVGTPFLPQGKVAIYNTQFEENGFNPMPEWVNPPELLTSDPEMAKKYPLAFFDAHTTDVYIHAWTHNLPSLRESVPDPWIHIHPDTAKKYGINEGDWVKIESPHGWAKAKAILFPGIRPDTVMGINGWWQGCDELGMPDYELGNGSPNTEVLFNADVKKAFDPMVSAMPKQTLVKISKLDK
jgi:anaerobic selenocysteine-containing dehydrogenase